MSHSLNRLQPRLTASKRFLLAGCSLSRRSPTIWLPTFMAKERVRTQRYFGHTRSFARLMLGLTYVRDERARHRTRRYQEFLELWQEIQARNVWSGLAETLQRSVGLQEREN